MLYEVITPLTTILMKYILLFSILFFISCHQNVKTEKDYLKFSEKFIYQIRHKKTDNLDKLFYDIDVIKTIDNTSDSLGFKNKTQRRIFHSKYNYRITSYNVCYTKLLRIFSSF